MNNITIREVRDMAAEEGWEISSKKAKALIRDAYFAALAYIANRISEEVLWQKDH